MNGGLSKGSRSQFPIPISKQAVIGLVLVIALISFELFNFDTTKYALANLLGNVNFIGVRWATILAIAFCAIDFAGLAHLLTPEQGRDEPQEVWYLMGAWLLGATMNALMTWWAVSLTLLEHSFGNEVLSREQLLRVVPIFVAALVWLTRILFIGALSVASENIFFTPAKTLRSINTNPRPARPAAVPSVQAAAGTTRPQPRYTAAATAVPPAPVRANQTTRVRQRPPLPPSASSSGMYAREGD